MNKYEIMMIFKPDVEDETRNTLLENFKSVLTRDEGVIDNVDEWGLRDFAYEVKKYTKGYYVVIDTHALPEHIAEFERLSRLNQNVLRHMTLRRG